MYPIVQAPNEILRTPTQQVDLPAEKLKKIIAGMAETLLAQDDPEGVGLAANQVGLPYQLFLARFTTKKDEPIRVFINPQIIDHSEEIQEETKKSPLEGCLSIPKYYGVVQRWRWVKLRYQTLTDTDRQGSDKSGYLTTSEEVFSGFPAVVIQHEMDHLKGKVFVERILEQNGQLYKTIGKDKKGKDKWQEVKL